MLTCAILMMSLYSVRYSGKLTSPSTLINSTNGSKERITRLLVVHADHHSQVDEAGAGSIVVAVGMKNTRTGDTIISSNASSLRGARLKGKGDFLKNKNKLKNRFFCFLDCIVCI